MEDIAALTQRYPTADQPLARHLSRRVVATKGTRIRLATEANGEVCDGARAVGEEDTVWSRISITAREGGDAIPGSAAQRFVAIDAHTADVMIGAVDARQTVVLEPRRVDLAPFPPWIAQHLSPTDAGVLDVTTNAWHLADQVWACGCAVVIANPLAVMLIAETAVARDRRATLTLARLLAGGFLPTIRVPSPHGRQLRNLVVRRERLVRQRTRARNRLHAILIRHAIVVPAGGLFRARQRGWGKDLSLDPDERLAARQDLAWLDTLAAWIDEREREVARLCTTGPGDRALPVLRQLPGMGIITAMTLLSAVGDIGRVPSAKQLVGDAGLGSRVHRSGTEQSGGRITTHGRTELRTAVVEVAGRAVTTSASWTERCRPLVRRRGTPQRSWRSPARSWSWSGPSSLSGRLAGRRTWSTSRARSSAGPRA